MKYPLIEIKSGDGDAGMWVGIRYRSKDGKRHNLYIVGGEETGQQPLGRKPFPMYFEHDDQSLSCYEGADKITVTDNSVTLTLNQNGRACLELPKTIELASAKAGRNFKKAKDMFVAMQKRHGGKVISVVNTLQHQK